MPLNADRLKQARKEKGLTFDELARRSGLDKTQIFRYEKGENDPSSTVLANLASLLEVSADYLLNLTDEPRGILGETLTSDERQMLIAYRGNNVPAMLEIFAERLRRILG